MHRCTAFAYEVLYVNRIIKWLLLIFVATLVVGGIASAMLTRSTGVTVAELHHEIRKSGDPLYFAEYASEPLADDENAHVHLMNAKPSLYAFDASLLELPSDDFIKGLTVSDEISGQTLDDLAKRLRDHSEFLVHLNRAAQCVRFRSDIDHDAGFGARYDYLPVARVAARALVARAIVMASRGNADEALKSCVIGLRIGQQIHQDPTLIPYLSAVSMQAQMLICAHHVLVTTETSKEVRDEYDQELARIDNSGAMMRALKGERALGIQTFDQIREGQRESLDGTSTPFWISGAGLKQAYINADESAYIRLMNRQIDLVRQPRPERIPVIQSMEAEMQEAGTRNVVTRLLVPALLTATDSMDWLEAMLRCSRVLRSLQEGGEAELEQLPVELRTDPYTEELLRINNQSGGWIIYSVGSNLADDHGDFSTEKSMYDSPDVGFHTGAPGESLDVSPVNATMR